MTEELVQTVQCTPPTSITRNEFGLLQNVNYVFDSNGFIDWKKMVKPEFLVPNVRKTSETDISKLSDDELIILLGGLRYLAFLRGYSTTIFEPVVSGSDYVAVVCRILWIPNYETEGRAITFSAVGDATPRNTSGFASDYLAAIAENRAFARCVRQFLRINIVSDEELKDIGIKKGENPSDPLSLLKSLMTEKGVDFDKIKKRLVKDGLLEANDYQKLEDIPAPKTYELIQLLKKSRKKKNS